jgi:hypothetical protein
MSKSTTALPFDGQEDLPAQGNASLGEAREALAIRAAQCGNAPALENNKVSRQAMVKMAKPARQSTPA